MKNIVIAGILGGIVIFIWSFISWVVIPWHNMVIHTIPGGEQVAEIMQNDNLPAGLYHYPGMGETEAETDAMMARYRQGPNINIMVYSPAGNDPMDPMQFLISLLLNILAAGLAACLLLKTLQTTPGLLQRALYVTGMGFFVVLTATLSEWNWWAFPGDFTLVMTVDTLIAWFLAGLVIAWRIRPTT